MTAPVEELEPTEPAEPVEPVDPGVSTAVGPDRFARWWRSLGRGQRVAAVVVAGVVLLNLALAGGQSLVGSEPGGPASSAFSTGAKGLEGYADLLRAEGHPVVRLQQRPTAADLPPEATVVLADPAGLSATSDRRLADFVAAGGRLVATGEDAAPLVAALTGTDLGWREDDPVDALAVWLTVDGTGAAQRIGGDDGGRWTDVGPLVPAAGADGRAALVVGDVGQGRVLALADTRPLQNASLARDDNAALALALAGPTGRRVVFVDAGAGSDGRGLAAVPVAWKWVAGLLAAALLVGIWSAGARFGPPEPQQRELRPPRKDHVDAVAADLDRVTPRPLDLAAALAEGEAAAAHQRVLHRRPPSAPDSPGATP
ncbi:DUF4350 domain-containing protein [Aquihabitans sp. G128]|uniref:DUF4350 domain-containing protein n=1 Tax=Aquihabitans sp. G128 TaxID=2849779 RepID=UPI001C23EB29|nr:DUF4350 domain-containing protein [Aquihabitans sp. G128]QXC61384.1 DUF4350 domain-containing protein [Aquihabitans sp. G128]